MSSRETVMWSKTLVGHEIEGSGLRRPYEYEVRVVRIGIADVKLVDITSNPAQTLARVTNTYNGKLSAETLPEEEVTKIIDDIFRTKLQTPMEHVHFVWLISNVTRAFTHQLVRYRVGTSFAQESMRFYGKHGIYRVLGTHLKPGEREAYGEAAARAIQGYVDLVDEGTADEDARGLLPTNILTDIFFDCSLRTLQGIMPQRLCCQAQQGEWQPILRKMRDLVAEKDPRLESLLRAPYEVGQPCGYRASFDRPCKWQEEN